MRRVRYTSLPIISSSDGVDLAEIIGGVCIELAASLPTMAALFWGQLFAIAIWANDLMHAAGVEMGAGPQRPSSVLKLAHILSSPYDEN